MFKLIRRKRKPQQVAGPQQAARVGQAAGGSPPAGCGGSPPAGCGADHGANTGALRARLNELDHDNLVAFIRAGFPAVIDHISPAMGKVDKIDELLDYCRREVRLDPLEAALAAYRPPPPLRRLAGANMGIDLVTPPGTIPWPQDRCPWNEAEQTGEHRCAVKGVSICRYFRGIEFLDTVVCAFPD